MTVHVITIAIGYTLNLVTGVVAHIYIVTRLSAPYQTERHHRLYQTTYVLLVAALIFSFAGTMLGGFWADQAWGRFWGWDPKENGALLIILWNALLLHARPARIVGEFGFGLATIVSIPVVLFSWVGVNLFGVGLHSYGFQNGSFVGLIGTIFVETLSIVSALVIRTGVPRPHLPGLRPFKLIRRESVAPDVFALTLAPASRAPDTRVQAILEAPAGRCVTVFVPHHGRVTGRVYSLSAWVPEHDTIRLTVQHLSDGVASTYLGESMRIGETVDILGPTGTFGISGVGPGTEVFLAAGVGVAPIVGMVGERLAGDADARIALYVAAASAAEIPHLQELIGFLDAAPRMDLYVVIGEASAGIESALLEHRRCHLLSRRLSVAAVVDTSDSIALWYVCGSERFVEDLEAERDAEEIPTPWHSERFQPFPDPPPEIGGKHHLTVRGRARSIPVRPGQSILHAAVDAGVEIPYGCGIGQCRDCLVRVVEGSVVQREPNALTDAERDRTDIALACVSYPSSSVEIDTAAPIAVEKAASRGIVYRTP